MRTFLFDLDGTITKKELLPEIGRACGLYKEIAALTRETIAGSIPFHESIRRRVDILKQVPISTVRKIVNSIPLNEPLLQFIREHRNRCVIITGNLDVWVKELCSRIVDRVFYSEAEADGDRLIGLRSILNKADAVKKIKGPIVVVGEGNNDVGMFEVAEVGIACGSLHEPASSVMERATHVIYNDATLCTFLKQLS